MSCTFETAERAYKKILRTHYYKTSFEKLKNAYLEYIKSQNWNLVDVNDTYGEIFVLEEGLFAITAKIEMQNPTETSIDFFVESNYFFARSAGYKLLKNIYAYLEKQFEFKGLSLHR